MKKYLLPVVIIAVLILGAVFLSGSSLRFGFTGNLFDLASVAGRPFKITLPVANNGIIAGLPLTVRWTKTGLNRGWDGTVYLKDSSGKTFEFSNQFDGRATTYTFTVPIGVKTGPATVGVKMERGTDMVKSEQAIKLVSFQPVINVSTSANMISGTAPQMIEIRWYGASAVPAHWRGRISVSGPLNQTIKDGLTPLSTTFSWLFSGSNPGIYTIKVEYYDPTGAQSRTFSGSATFQRLSF